MKERNSNDNKMKIIKTIMLYGRHNKKGKGESGYINVKRNSGLKIEREKGGGHEKKIIKACSERDTGRK